MGLREFLHSLRATSPSSIAARVIEVHAQVNAIDRARAEAAVRDCVFAGDPFNAEQASHEVREAPMVRRLPPAARALFEAYAWIDAGGMRLAHDALAPFARDRALTTLGEDLEYASVVVRQTDDHVFVIEDDGMSTPGLNEEHPTVWHYLLVVAEQSRPGILRHVPFLSSAGNRPLQQTKPRDILGALKYHACGFAAERQDVRLNTDRGAAAVKTTSQWR